eukprot:TRINITY_DN1183_c0_g1_i1.p1 TRINITY_DN1183_c0_g1~~TRINITY_DN1183_c0_g1_i1.p1  ORF type:complete len:379 (+),score=63.46 TRINITY_DN1183_c0_g1_i1:1987-3123(+)
MRLPPRSRRRTHSRRITMSPHRSSHTRYTKLSSTQRPNFISRRCRPIFTITVRHCCTVLCAPPPAVLTSFLLLADYYNFNADCTINQSLGDGQNYHIISSQPQAAQRPPHASQVNPIAPVPPVQPPLRSSHAPPQQRHYAPHQPLPPPPLSALPSVRSLPRISPLTDRPSKRSRLSARTMPSSTSSGSDAVEDSFPLMATRSYGSTSADVDESSLNDWEAVVEMYLHGTGAPDGVPLREICKGDGRRVHDRKLLEKRRTIGKTYELLGAPRFEAAIGYRWENGMRRKQKMYNVISRCRIVNAMRKAGEAIPDDFGTLTNLIDTRLREKERAKEQRDAKRNAEQARLNAMAGTTRIAVMPGAARDNSASVALVRRADAS